MVRGRTMKRWTPLNTGSRSRSSSRGSANCSRAPAAVRACSTCDLGTPITAQFTPTPQGSPAQAHQVMMSRVYCTGPPGMMTSAWFQSRHNLNSLPALYTPVKNLNNQVLAPTARCL